MNVPLERREIEHGLRTGDIRGVVATNALELGIDIGELSNVPLGNDYPEIREAVRAICKKFPAEYWRKLEDEEAYASEFVAALTEAGVLPPIVAGEPARRPTEVFAQPASAMRPRSATIARMDFTLRF